MSVKVEKITEIKYASKMGQAPFWDHDKKILYFVDSFDGYIHRYNPSDKSYVRLHTGEKKPGFIIPIQGKDDNFIVALDNKIIHIEWDGKKEEFKEEKTLFEADKGHVFSEGKCDSKGRLWTASFSFSNNNFRNLKPDGVLKSYEGSDDDKAKKHKENILLPNGIAIDEKNKRFYYSLTLKREIERYEFDVEKPELKKPEGGEERWFILNVGGTGEPEQGLTGAVAVDENGKLWTTVLLAGMIKQIGTSKDDKNENKKERGGDGTIMKTITIENAHQVTSLTFGGKDLDELYVTTSTDEFESRRSVGKDDGSVFKITGLGVKGLPSFKFKLE